MWTSRAASQKAAIAEVASSLLQRISLTIDGEPVEVTEALEIGDGVILVIEGGETDSLEGDMIRALSRSGPIPAGKRGTRFPGVPAQSWGDVKEAVDPKVEASP